MPEVENLYLKYRGKCKQECEKLIKKNPELTLVKGWYYEPIWRTKEQHFWCKDKNGKIIDPTREQFPSKGLIEEFYEEYNGIVDCSECGKKIEEKDVIMQGRYPVCSGECALKLVGLDFK